jgi:hypothetical protein
MKSAKKLGLYRVQTHGKEDKSPLPCASTRQRGHVSSNCKPESAVLDQMVIVLGKYTRQRHDMAKIGARHGAGPRVVWQSKPDTRQLQHTADHLPCPQGHTVERGPHPGEQQRPKSLYCAVHAQIHTADTLPCLANDDTRQTSSAVAVTVVYSLPCVHTRQMVYRVQKHLYRVNGTHGRDQDSGSAWQIMVRNNGTHPVFLSLLA